MTAPKKAPAVGPMSKDEYNAAREALGLSVVGACVLGVSKRQAQRLSYGEQPVPPPLAILLRTMLKHKLTPDDLP